MFENDCDRSKFFVSRVNGAPYTTSLLCALSFAMSFMCASAGIVEYPKAGGNLADNGPDGWNGQKPGLSDNVKIVQSGIYTSTDDVEFYSIRCSPLPIPNEPPSVSMAELGLWRMAGRLRSVLSLQVSQWRFPAAVC